MTDITGPEHRQAAQALREVLAAQRDHEDLISIGAYRRGANRHVDLAIEMQADINAFLRQRVDERCSVEQARDLLVQLQRRMQTRPQAPAIPATTAAYPTEQRA
jgi:flagellum-specific ATP synthase